MPTYLTWIPGQNLNAEVDAPDSKHARTAFLDYMSRNGMIRWKERQAVRKQIKTERVEPGEVQTTVQLDYDMGDSSDVPSQMMGVGPTPRVGGDYEDLDMDDAMALVEAYAEPTEQRPSVTPQRTGDLDVRVRPSQVPDVRPSGAQMQRLKQATAGAPTPMTAPTPGSVVAEAAGTPIGRISKQMGSVGSKLRDLTVTYPVR